MAQDQNRKEALAKKYGAASIEDAARRHGSDFPAIVDWADEIDPHYAKIWLDFTYGGMFKRGILDERTRTLVVVGQFVALDELSQLPVYIRSALAAGATPREVLEVVLQLGVYVGYPRMVRATRVVKQVMTELGRMDEITDKQLPIAGPPRESSLEEARATWQTPADQVPRREELLKKYGWRSLSPGLRLQPTHHVQSANRLDRVDQHFNKLWLDFIYAGMYSRGVLDDRTRILCIVGELYVMGEFHQAEHHIRNALTGGATPREVLEVILHSTIYAGMPRFVRFIGILERALEEQGRLHEITETQPPLPDTDTPTPG
jgi:alkylhydroperoxidase/carboxymuconolactone decarboxylase family protein YurZ